MRLLAFKKRTPLLRFAILAIALWQVGAAFEPHTGTPSGATSTRPHWHATGDALETGHDETACPVCSMQHTARTVVHPARMPLDAVRVVRFRPGVGNRPLIVSAYLCVFSRAPPSLA